MILQERVLELLKTEHTQLRAALPGVGEEIALIPLPGTGKRKPPPKVPKGQPPPPPEREFDPRPLLGAWTSFRQRVEPHLDYVRDRFLPMCVDVAVHKNWKRRGELEAAIEAMQAELSELKRLAGNVRYETVKQDAAVVRRSVLQAISLFEAHTRVLTNEIIVGVETGETPVARKRTSDEIMRNLRASRAFEPEPEPEPPPPAAAGFFERLFGAFGK